ncbi:hypothetical protein B0H19DRAFT_1065714 [Mycena capillaripes]|nr:hypothetical protein B0H19DRAFT_1065714 [Mycena capillaripes]
MASPAANHVPNEIISEILTPLLMHPDEVFSDRSEKALLEPGYLSATYLLVCKAWFRVSTPLLYNVVILRTTAQAEALQAVLKTNPEIGQFIKKLRVEGAFGNSMHTILKSASNITDLFSRFLFGAQIMFQEKPRKNKLVTQLFETLRKLIPKWNKLVRYGPGFIKQSLIAKQQTFDFPYALDCNPTLNARAEALVSALRESPNLETLIVDTGFSDGFPNHFRPVVNMPSLKRLHFVSRWITNRLRTVVEKDPKLKAIVTFSSPE